MEFFARRKKQSRRNWESPEIRNAASQWHDFSRTIDYQYMFDWCGTPIIQDPQDVLMMHEVLWDFRPNVVIETGVARGGSLMLSASVLAAQAFVESSMSRSRPLVIGIDIDIRSHNRKAIEAHSLSGLIRLIQGSSTDRSVVEEVANLIIPGNRVALILDSNHTHSHVYSELIAYSGFVSPGGPIIVMDTGIEFAPVASFNAERPWGPGNSPYSAVQAFLKEDAGGDFSVDTAFQERHLITAARDGLLRRQ